MPYMPASSAANIPEVFRVGVVILNHCIKPPKSWVTPEVVSSNQGRIRLEMSRDATTRLRGR